MGEEYETDKGKEADHRILKILDTYAQEVKNAELPRAHAASCRTRSKQTLTEHQRRDSSDRKRCAGCHQADYNIWTKTKHSHAYEALTKKAEKPKLRQYDPGVRRLPHGRLRLPIGLHERGGDEAPVARRLRELPRTRRAHAPTPKNAAYYRPA